LCLLEGIKSSSFFHSASNGFMLHFLFFLFSFLELNFIFLHMFNWPLDDNFGMKLIFFWNGGINIIFWNKFDENFHLFVFLI